MSAASKRLKAFFRAPTNSLWVDCGAHKCVSATNKIFVARFVAQIRQTTGEVIVDFVARLWREIQIKQQKSV